jgi:RNA polymerase sigma-70 factor (ECF subfamily)
MVRLLMQHRTALYGYIFACVRNHDDAEDILQEVSLAVTEAFDKLRDDDGFLPWSREIARRQVLTHIRKSNRTTIVEPEIVEVLAEASARVSERDDADRRNQVLLDCLESLPPKSREIIQMRYDGSVAGVPELAEKIERTVSATYGVLKRVRQTLRDCVDRKLAMETD